MNAELVRIARPCFASFRDLLGYMQSDVDEEEREVVPNLHTDT